MKPIIVWQSVPLTIKERTETENVVFDDLIKAVKSRDYEGVRRAVSTGKINKLWACADREAKTPLMLAAESDDLAMIELLLPVSDLDVAGGREEATALMFAAKAGSADCVKALLRAGKPSLLRASDAFLKSMSVGFLHDQQAYLPLPGALRLSGVGLKSPLVFAAESGSVECVVALLPESNLGSSSYQGVMTESPYKMTPLMCAAKAGSVDCVKALLSASDAKEIETRDGMTALMFAVKSGSVDCVKALLSASDPLVKNENGKTALMMAVESGNLDMLTLLLPVSNLQARDKNGETPLMLAAKSGFEKGVKVLLPDSDLLVENKKGQTSLMLAEGSGSSACVKMIDERVPKIDKGSIGWKLQQRRLAVKDKVVEGPRLN